MFCGLSTPKMNGLGSVKPGQKGATFRLPRWGMA